jgi:hypothetical protein
MRFGSSTGFSMYVLHLDYQMYSMHALPFGYEL